VRLFATQIVEKHLTSAHFMNADEQLVVARGYKRLEAKIRKLKRQLDGCSKRVSAAYEHGAQDERSRNMYANHDMGR
jgi:hypothetical protein